MPHPVDHKFLLAVHKLTAGLRHAYEQSGAKKPLRTVIEEITVQLQKGEAADLAEAFVDGNFVETKELDLIRVAFASVFQAYSVEQVRPGHGLPHLAQAYFFAGMAHMAHSAAAGPRQKAAASGALKARMKDLARIHCPPEKWPSIEAVWRAIAEDVIRLHADLIPKRGDEDQAYRIFKQLAREERTYFLQLLSGPVRQGRKPSGKRRGTGDIAV